MGSIPTPGTMERMTQRTVLDWLLDSDPAIRWQVMRDLVDASDEEVSSERDRVASQGWGARLLALQDEDGYWAGGAYMPANFSWTEIERDGERRLIAQPWTATFWSLVLLRTLGIDPNSDAARTAVAKVAENVRWEHDGQRFFDGEVEPCINGRVVALGAYFGQDVSGVVDRLLTEQMDDGGWNCEQENGSTRGSFHTTISVLEGLLEFETFVGPTAETREVRARGEEFMLERRLMRRLLDGEVIDERWTRFAFPIYWHYDVLRGLDYLQSAGRPVDERTAEGLELVERNRMGDGRWPRQNVHPGAVHFDVDVAEGEPSRWNTLRVLRVLNWAKGTG